MDWIKKITLISALAGLVCVVVSCRISMGLAPISSIDYSKVKTITIAEFPNRAEAGGAAPARRRPHGSIGTIPMAWEPDARPEHHVRSASPSREEKH